MRPRTVTPAPERIDPILTRARRETAWQQEVRERLRARRDKRGEGQDLPLFGGLALADRAPLPEPLPMMDAPGFTDLPLQTVARPSDAIEVEVERAEEPAPTCIGSLHTHSGAVFTAELPLPANTLERKAPTLEAALSQSPQAPPSAERVAKWGERLSAGLVDSGLFASMMVVVAYFTNRLAPAVLDAGSAAGWFGLFATLLGGFYAGYFTGTTGQTPGKMLQHLRVVDSEGRAPGFVRALGRAVVGAAGVALCGVGAVPAAFDPANRAFHDRLFDTCVVRQ